MTTPRPPEKLLTIREPVECTQCGELMPDGTTAWIPGWGRIEHWYSANGCDAYEEDDDWDDDEEDDL
ncbi:hypothetical protein [Brachybacterium massiliense]|uniref:hypothetical protein n=1 Tax=Brachybacterium massiliense TaxID=1755098 RepID=UPI000B3BB905|nr:hypothetical protein [Brachybacterium massiliense]